MQAWRAQSQSGSRAETGIPVQPHGQTLPSWAHEWAEADAAEHAEWGNARSRLVLIGMLALVGAATAAVFPLTPGFSASDASAAVIAAAVTSLLGVSVVYLADRSARALSGSAAGDLLIFAAALASVGAATVHFAVAKMHFDEYTLFGVFFVLSGIAQLVWPVWLLFRGWTPLLALGAIGNGLIVALWAVDRIWGLPLGPEHWKPDPVGFGDTIASAFEVALVVLCLAVLIRDRRKPVSGHSALGLSFFVAALTTLALLSVLGVASSVLTPSM